MLPLSCAGSAGAGAHTHTHTSVRNYVKNKVILLFLNFLMLLWGTAAPKKNMIALHEFFFPRLLWIVHFFFFKYENFKLHHVI